MYVARVGPEQGEGRRKATIHALRYLCCHCGCHMCCAHAYIYVVTSYYVMFIIRGAVEHIEFYKWNKSKQSLDGVRYDVAEKQKKK